jgi:hypothetical protein
MLVGQAPRGFPERNGRGNGKHTFLYAIHQAQRQQWMQTPSWCLRLCRMTPQHCEGSVFVKYEQWSVKQINIDRRTDLERNRRKGSLGKLEQANKHCKNRRKNLRSVQSKKRMNDTLVQNEKHSSNTCLQGGTVQEDRQARLLQWRQH